MKSGYRSFIIWLGSVLLAICLTSHNILRESPILGYTMLFTGITNPGLGLFLKFQGVIKEAAVLNFTKFNNPDYSSEGDLQKIVAFYDKGQAKITVMLKKSS